MKNLAPLLFFCLASNSWAFNVELFPEAADKNAFFLNAKAVTLSFADGFILDAQEFGFDYVLPVIPLSLGAYFKIPTPNLKSFGARLAYHLNIENEKLDLYALYVFDCGFVRNSLLLEYGDEEQPLRWYDFRVGIRRLFTVFCLAVETDYKLHGINIGISLKLN